MDVLCLWVLVGSWHLLLSSAHRSLLPEYGVGFRKVGQLQPTSDRHFLTLDFVIPRLKKTTSVRWELTFSCDKLKKSLSEYSVGLCTDFVPTFEGFSEQLIDYERRINDRYAEIDILLPATVGRTKRVAPLVAAGLAIGIVGISSMFVTGSRINALQTSVNELEKRHYQLNNAFVDLRSDMITIAQLTADQIDDLYKSIAKTNSELSQVTRNIVAFQDHYNATLYEVASRFQGVKVMSKIISKAFRLMSMNHNYCERLLGYLSEYEDAVVSLLQGRLPKELVPPVVLKRIIDHAAVQIYSVEPDYTLTFTELSHYYSYSDIVYTIQGEHLVVVVPLFLRLRAQPVLDLFRVASVHVPLNMSAVEQGPKAYSKIRFKHDYLGILDKDFVEISNANLDGCVKYGDLYICEDTMLQIHHSKETCASSLFWNRPMAIIKEVCEIETFSELSPTAAILENEDEILLANIGSDWTLACQNRNVPIRVTGHPYSIVNRRSFCHCSLTSRNYFVSQRVTKCDSRVDSLRMKYVINAMLLSTFVSESNRVLADINVSTLYDEIPRVLNTDILHMLSEAKFTDSNSKQLSRFVKTLQSKTPNFIEQLHMEGMHRWYENDIVKGMSVILSFLSLAMAACILVLCCRHHKMAILLPALAMPQPVHASSIECRMPVVDILGLTAIIVLSICLIRVCIKLSRYCTKGYNVWRNSRIAKCVVSLQIISRSDFFTINLLTIHGRLVDLSPENDVEVNIEEFKNHTFYGLLNLKIERNLVRLFSKTTAFTVPTTLYVNFFQKDKVANMVKTDHVCRVVVTDRISTVIMGVNTISDLWP